MLKLNSYSLVQANIIPLCQAALTEHIGPVTYLPIPTQQRTAAASLPRAVCRSLSLSLPVLHLFALLGRKGHEEKQQKECKLSETSLRTPVVHPDPADQQKSNLSSSLRDS